MLPGTHAPHVACRNPWVQPCWPVCLHLLPAAALPQLRAKKKGPQSHLCPSVGPTLAQCCPTVPPLRGLMQGLEDSSIKETVPSNTDWSSSNSNLLGSKNRRAWLLLGSVQGALDQAFTKGTCRAPVSHSAVRGLTRTKETALWKPEAKTKELNQWNICWLYLKIKLNT